LVQLSSRVRLSRLGDGWGVVLADLLDRDGCHLVRMARGSYLRTLAIAGVCAVAVIGALHWKSRVGGADHRIKIGLIIKTNGNPFFVRMREGAVSRAQQAGVELLTFAGAFDGDNDAQVMAIEELVSLHAAGILISPNDPKAIVKAVGKARQAGIMVIALDTPLDPMTAADATFASDNQKAGTLIGAWAAGMLGSRIADAHVAFLDAFESEITVDLARDQGFMKGFGIAIADPLRYGQETDKRIAGHQWGKGTEDGGRTGMENLLQKDPKINVVYTINEPTAAGAVKALQAVGRDPSTILVTSIDGSCPGISNVHSGLIGAIAMQFPTAMATRGIDAVVEFARTGRRPMAPPEGFFDTGITLVTDKPIAGLSSISSTAGLERCWG
jgi:fructose transport system substrate-binding protein